MRGPTSEKRAMSKSFYLAVSLICLSFAGYETVLNFYLRRVNDQVFAVCVRPAQVPPVSSRAVLFIPREAL